MNFLLYGCLAEGKALFRLGSTGPLTAHSALPSAWRLGSMCAITV